MVTFSSSRKIRLGNIEVNFLHKKSNVLFKHINDPYPLERYTTEAKRILGVLEKRLEGREYLIDFGYTIADMATFPWVICLTVRTDNQVIEPASYNLFSSFSVNLIEILQC